MAADDNARVAALDDGLVALLENAPALADRASRLMEPLLDQRDTMRQRLTADGLLRAVPSITDVPPVAAVDGARVTESLYAGDLVAAVAVAVEDPAGNTPQRGLSWTDFLAHVEDVETITKAAMLAAEARLVADMADDSSGLVLLDGSHLTPPIAISQALASSNRSGLDVTMDMLDEFDAVDALTRLCDPQATPQVVGCPKTDSDSALVEDLKRRYGVEFAGSDKLVATLLLESGEMTAPAPLPRRWANMRITVDDDAPEPVRKVAARLDRAVSKLRSQPPPVTVTYVKPAGSTTAIKLEIKDGADVEWTAAAVAGSTAPPHLQEPISQAVADRHAKRVGPTMRAARQAITSEAAKTSGDRAFWVEYLMRSART